MKEKEPEKSIEESPLERTQVLPFSVKDVLPKSDKPWLCQACGKRVATIREHWCGKMDAWIKKHNQPK